MLVGGHDVQDVVHHLEGQPVVAAELGEGVHRRPIQPGYQAADATRGGQQRGGFALDGVGVGTLGAIGVAGVLQLPHLALAQPSDGGGQQPGHLGTQRCRKFRCPGQQEIAGQDGPQVAPLGVHAGHVAPNLGLVHHVVVVQRSQMDQLHRHTTGEHVIGGRRRLILGDGRRSDHEPRSDPLAPRPNEMAGHFGEERVLGLHRAF